MAIVQSIATGKMRKSAGTASFYQRHGQTIMRQKPLTVANPKTTLQSLQRAKIGNNAAFYNALSKALTACEWIPEPQGGRTSYQEFVKRAAAYGINAYNVKGEQVKFNAPQQLPAKTWLKSYVNGAIVCEPCAITALENPEDINGNPIEQLNSLVSFKMGLKVGQTYEKIDDTNFDQIVAETALNGGSLPRAGVYVLAEMLHRDSGKHFFVFKCLVGSQEYAYEMQELGAEDVKISFKSDESSEMVATIDATADNLIVLAYTCGFCGDDYNQILLDLGNVFVSLPGKYDAIAKQSTLVKMKSAIKSYGGDVSKVAAGYKENIYPVFYKTADKKINIVSNPPKSGQFTKIWAIVPAKVGDVIPACLIDITNTYTPSTGPTYAFFDFSGDTEKYAGIIAAAEKAHTSIVFTQSKTKEITTTFSPFVSDKGFYTNVISASVLMQVQ